MAQVFVLVISTIVALLMLGPGAAAIVLVAGVYAIYARWVAVPDEHDVSHAVVEAVERTRTVLSDLSPLDSK